MAKKIITLLFISLFYGVKAQNSFLDSHFYSDFYQNQWTGFYLFDPSSQKELYSYQGNKYFIPASNTKILALYTGLKMLPDSIPSLQYTINKDTLYIKGTGDPTLLESFFKERKVIDFLISRKEKIALYTRHFNDSKFAPGWSWDDYAEYYSPERSSFPLYGNIVNIYSPTHTVPSLFVKNVKRLKSEYNRDFNNNTFYLPVNKHLEVPFITSDSLTIKILEEETKKTITLTKNFPQGKVNTLYSIPADNLYKRMMLVSDNFIAEQILLMSSIYLSDKMNSKIVIDYLLSNQLKNLPQAPKWVDGSGLSRYNNITPEDFVYILNDLYKDIPQERLLSFFPIGGVSGTIKNSYRGNPPYIFAKTGSMGQVYNLSGFLLTRSKKILIFSFMNNNFRHANSSIKANMQKVLEYVRDNY